MPRARNCATASCACPAQLGITLRRHWYRGMHLSYTPGVGDDPFDASENRRMARGERYFGGAAAYSRSPATSRASLLVWNI